MAVIVAAADAEAALRELAGAGEQVWKIGHVRARREGEAQTTVV
jgi:phosphoribosylformylglycinamidine cyclo-ligase